MPEVNIQTRNHDIKGKKKYFNIAYPISNLKIPVGNNTTVISVRGTGASRDNSNMELVSDKSGVKVNNTQDNSKERTSSFNQDDVENPVS